MDRPMDTDVLTELRSARPEAPADLLSPDSERAQRMLRCIITESPSVKVPRHRSRVRLTMAVSASAAAVVISVLIALPDRDQDQAVGSASTDAMSPPGPSSADSAVAAPTIDPDGPRTARAQLIVSTPTALGVENLQLTLVGDDVSYRTWVPPSSGRPGYFMENRWVDGESYLYSPGDVGVLQWWHVGSEGPPGGLPNGSTPYVLLDRLSSLTEFDSIEEDQIDGVAVTHLSALRPAAIDPQGLPIGDAIWGATAVDGLDIWVTDNGIVLRLKSAVATDLIPDAETTEVASVELEFTDVGAEISLGVPPNAEDTGGFG